MPWIHAENRATDEEYRESALTNGRFLTPDGIVKGTLVMCDGLITDLGSGTPGFAEDLEGDLLVPGFVELHTDNLEKHIMPRPGIYWTDPVAAVEAHDAQLVSSGITTVFDSVCVGEPIDKGRRVMLSLSLNALAQGKANLRAEHMLHLRCEVSDPEMGALMDEALGLSEPDMVSIMDHTPGQRQWRTPKDWLVYHQAKMPEDELMRVSKILKDARDSCADLNTAKIAGYSRKRGITLATHDDTEQKHIEDAVELGARISEFPTTLEAAKAAREAGLYTVVGAPNLVRGSSHSGNVKASEIADLGLLSCLPSDYVPASLLHGAWKLHAEHGYSLQDAFATVSKNPARAARLSDRGALLPGMRADLVRITETDGRPRVSAVWVAGLRVF
jgi:alpha-D-ribose 1-methylphosphonate 5-triphosphate diphosphatase